MENIRFKFSKNIEINRNSDLILIANTKTGAWIKLSNECYEIIKHSIDQHLIYTDYLEQFLDEKDKEYMDDLIKKLYDSKFIISEDYDETSDFDSVYFAITNRCNLYCKHCCYNAKNITTNNDLSIDEAKKIIDKISKLNPKTFIISGGEPMLRDDFYDLLIYSRKKINGKIAIMTNGTLITESKVNLLCENVDYLDLSLDSVDEESCSKIRGKNVFNKVINSINLLKKHKFNNINLSMTITEQNKHLKKSFEELCEKYKVERVFRYFSPIGRGKINKNDLEVVQNKNKSEKNFNPSKIQILEARKKIKCYTCSAVKNTIFVDYNGAVSK